MPGPLCPYHRRMQTGRNNPSTSSPPTWKRIWAGLKEAWFVKTVVELLGTAFGLGFLSTSVVVGAGVLIGGIVESLPRTVLIVTAMGAVVLTMWLFIGVHT